MSALELAVQGCTFKYTIGVTGAPPTVVTPPSTKVKATNKGIYFKQIDITLSGLSYAGCVQTTPVNTSIMPTSADNKVEGELVMRKGDKVVAVPIVGASGGSPCNFTTDVEVDDPAQTDVKGT